MRTLGTYLGAYTITPFDKDITVECYGTINPSQKQTLEQEGLSAHVEVEVVMHGEIDISDYISSDIWDELETKING